MNFQQNHRLKIAVVGTGIAGMSAAWLLNQRHHITVYEGNGRLGGHANTVDVPSATGLCPVDTGFIVYNTRNYPNLTALFDHLAVPTKPSDMSFAASLRGGALEYAGSDLNSLLGQRRNIVRPRFWRMVRDLLRFYREAPADLAHADATGLSLGDYLSRRSYGRPFVEDHLLPMGAAIWSTTPPDMLAYPAAAFIRFFASHGLLALENRPQWRTVAGGSRAYVKLLTQGYKDRVRFTAVRAIHRKPNGVTVVDSQGLSETYDHVVLATHADEAHHLLTDADPLENKLLGSWRYTRNTAVLHTDQSLMPKCKRVWASWNFIGTTASPSEQALCVSYWMNRLQDLRDPADLFVTLNPLHEPASESVFQRIEYTHPFFDAAALQSQRQLWRLQGRRRTWFCGSYFGYGFHEDALQSGLAVAEALGGVRRPWDVKGQNDRLYLPDREEIQAA